MEVIILENAEAVAKRSADIVCHQVNKDAGSVLGLATGSTPVALYKELIERNKAGQVSFKKTISYNLDEYVGLAQTHPQSYRFFMNETFFDHIDIDKSKTHVPDGSADNPMEVGPAYEKAIKASGGIDLQILGIGSNGHIGFNEPTSSLGSRTRIKTLTEQTVKDNSRFFKDDEFQPRLAITMGIATIMESKRVLLIATGESKAEAIAASVEGPLAAACPASILQSHPNTTFLIDSAAASKLKMTSYYKWVLSQQDELTSKYGDPR